MTVDCHRNSPGRGSLVEGPDPRGSRGHTGYTRRTGGPIQITARKVLMFKPSDVLREIINS